jgi:hypothetical protein
MCLVLCNPGRPGYGHETERMGGSVPWKGYWVMNRDKFVELLNEDLSTEYQSIVQYNLHISTVTGAEYVSTIDELAVHLTRR